MLNKIMLIGHLGRDPEMTYTPDGTALTRFSLAVSRNTKTSTGEKKEETDWFNITAWRQLAEICSKYLRKGSKVYVEGRLSPRKYTDRDGNQRTALDVTINEMEMLSSKQQTQGSPEDFLAGQTGDADSLGDLEETPPF